MKVTKANYRDVAPEALAEFLGNGTAQIVETSIEGVIEIVKYLAENIGQRKLLKKRVEVLEETLKAQNQLLTKIIEKVGL